MKILVLIQMLLLVLACAADELSLVAADSGSADLPVSAAN